VSSYGCFRGEAAVPTGTLDAIALDELQSSRRRRTGSFEGGVKDVLEFSFGAGAFEQAGLKMTTLQTSEEQLEINWSV
jgi:hypothetical protein